MHHIACLVFLVAAVGVAAPARADLLQIGAGSWSDVGTGTETWLRSPSGSNTITIPVLNNTASGSQTATMFGWALGIEFIPQSGASGTLTISNLANPSNNALTGSPGTPTAFVNSSPSYTVVSNQNNNLVGSQVPSSGSNLVTFNLTSTNAVGTFKMVAFNDSTNGYSNWTYFNAANGSDPNNGNDFAFTNIAASGSFPGTESQFVLGTINVLSPSAVPEPGSMILAGIGAVVSAGYGWRRRRQATREQVPAIAEVA